MRKIVSLLAALCLLTSANALAKDELSVSHASARATAPGQDTALVTLHITSASDAELIAVSSPLASSAEIHSMSHENGMMKMRPVERLALPAGQEIVLGKDGNHLMLMGLKKGLRAGDVVLLRLTVQFAKQRTLTIQAKAKVTSMSAPHDEHHH